MLNAQIAQLVEQRTENPRVTGSIPVLGIFLCYKIFISAENKTEYGRVAQVVEHLTFNQVVRGSNPRTLIFHVGDQSPALFVLEKICRKIEKSRDDTHRLRKEENIY